MLRCAHCAVGSPYLRPSFYDLAQFEKDVNVLAQAMHLGQFRLIGGEPLMVPNLSEYVSVARASGLCDWLSTTTNGILLERATEDLLTSFDLIVVSIYHNLGDARNEQILRGLQKLIPLEGQGRLKHVVIVDTDDFRLAEIDCRIDDPVLVRRIWDECSQKELCSCLRDGYIYRCTAGSRKGAYLKSIGRDDVEHLLDPRLDGLSVHEPDLEERLRQYFERDEPHEMCYYCLGNSSKPFTHRQLTRQEVEERRPTYLDAREMLMDKEPTLNTYTGNQVETSDSACPICGGTGEVFRCSWCTMGVLHEECDKTYIGSCTCGGGDEKAT